MRINWRNLFFFVMASIPFVVLVLWIAPPPFLFFPIGFVFGMILSNFLPPVEFY